MTTPKINEICWLIKRENNSVQVLGFLRDSHEGVFIIGGDTGSYYSGHGERWQKKWDEYSRKLYVSKDLAIEKGLISVDWKPPRITKMDQELIDKIKNNMI